MMSARRPNGFPNPRPNLRADSRPAVSHGAPQEKRMSPSKKSTKATILASAPPSFGSFSEFRLFGSPVDQHLGHHWRGLLATLLVVSLFISAPGMDDSAWAKKKGKKGPTPEQLEKQLQEAITPMNETLSKLVIKIQSHYIFSPKESEEMTDIYFKLLALMKDHGSNPLMVQPVYQAAILQMMRENYDEAFDLFGFLTTNFPEDPYTLRAKQQVKKMKREMLAKGYTAEDFPEEPVPPAAEPADAKPSK